MWALNFANRSVFYKRIHGLTSFSTSRPPRGHSAWHLGCVLQWRHNADELSNCQNIGILNLLDILKAGCVRWYSGSEMAAKAEDFTHLGGGGAGRCTHRKNCCMAGAGSK